MTESRASRCFLLGAESLLVACAEQVLQSEHELAGVISDDERVVAWARESGVRRVSLAEQRTVLAERPFDYLFAIAHLALVPADVLAMPTQLAVNFHDGPLPRYSGLNAPAWALMNGESEHGVSWHVMTADVDAGDLLAQVRFSIEPDATTLSLNARCFEAGVESFAQVLAQIGAGTLDPRPQVREGRTYFGRFERPAAAAVIDWRRPAAELSALVRGLDFGPRYPNRLGLPKLAHGRRVLAVASVRAAPELGVGRPGTVLAVDDEAVLVAAGDRQALAMTGFLTLSGRPLSAAEGAAALGLSLGTLLSEPSSQVRERLGRLDAELARSETFWTRRLARLAPAQLPQAEVADVRAGAPPMSEADLNVPDSVRTWCVSRNLHLGVALAAGLQVYLLLLSGKARCHVAFRDEALRETTDGVEAWVAPVVPLQGDLEAGWTFDQVLRALATELERVRRRGTWLRDLIARQPRLREQSPLEDGSGLPVGVELLEHGRTAELLPGTLFTLASTGDRAICCYDASRLSESAVASIHRELLALLVRLVAGANRPIGQLGAVDE